MGQLFPENHDHIGFLLEMRLRSLCRLWKGAGDSENHDHIGFLLEMRLGGLCRLWKGAGDSERSWSGLSCMLGISPVGFFLFLYQEYSFFQIVAPH